MGCAHTWQMTGAGKAQLPCEATHRDGLKLLAQQARLLVPPLLARLSRRLEARRHDAATAFINMPETVRAASPALFEARHAPRAGDHAPAARLTASGRCALCSSPAAMHVGHVATESCTPGRVEAQEAQHRAARLPPMT